MPGWNWKLAGSSSASTSTNTRSRAAIKAGCEDGQTIARRDRASARSWSPRPAGALEEHVPATAASSSAPTSAVCRSRLPRPVNWATVLGSCWLQRPECYSTGASNCAHHFGRARAGTFAEQLILHDCVSHANRPLLLSAASGAAAALAAGDDNEGGPEGAAICGPTGPATGGGSFLDKSPVAHPASNKTSNAATFLMTFI
jgi:hypothetical protein